MPLPVIVSQLRSFLGELSSYGIGNFYTFWLSAPDRPMTDSLKQRVPFFFKVDMVDTAKYLWHELSVPPVPLFSDWDASIEEIRQFRLDCDCDRNAP